MSDDSHGIDQVGTNYGRALKFADKHDISTFTYLERGPCTKDGRFPGVSTNKISVVELKEHPLFA